MGNRWRYVVLARRGDRMGFLSIREGLFREEAKHFFAQKLFRSFWVLSWYVAFAIPAEY